MPFPSAESFREAKWLAFFAELTAKLTHHNALVVMEGAELLKRLLISRVSIAAVLQQGDLLVRLLDTWRGCVLAERPRDTLHQPHDDDGTASTSQPASSPPSVAVALNDELSFVLAESISQCIDLMVALHADGDPYYSLLVLARAGPMLEVLVDVLQMAPPQLYGVTAGLLQQVLALPLGRDAVGGTGGRGEEDNESGVRGLDAATVHHLRRSLPLQRHVRALVAAVQEHGALLQHTADTLAELLAAQQGPRRLAAVHLFNLAARRLRKYELRQGRRTAPAAPSAASPSVAAPETPAENSELDVTITGAAPPQRSSAATVSSSPSPDAVASSALDDLEGGLPARARPAHPTAATAKVRHAAPSTDHAAPRAPSPAAVNPAPDSASPLQPHDVSAVVDAEPPRLACVVPPAMAEEALRHLAACRSHDAFFDALDWVWCLTVADAAAVGAVLTPEALQRSLARYLTAAPRTRRDRILFTLLLLWLGHLHAVSAVRGDTHRAVLQLAATALLPMLRAELTEGEQVRPAPAAHAASSTSLNVSAITPPTATTIGGATSATLLSTSGAAAPHLTALSLDPSPAAALHRGLPTLSGSTLLPYAAARKAQEAAVLLRPSIAVILLSFLLQMHEGAPAEAQRAWVSQGRVLDIAQAAVRRAQGCRSALLDTPVSIDGALSDEVYLDAALRGVRTDATTVAVLGCRLVAAVLGARLRWGGVGLGETTALQPPPSPPHIHSTTATPTTTSADADVALAAQALLPLLVEVAVHNPDVAAARESGAASPVHHVPGNLRCARYTSLGECALAALDACLQHHAQTGHLRSRGEVPMSVAGFAVEDVVRVLPSVTRVSQGSVHPPVRAVPYRLLLCVSHRLDDVLVVLRHTPSLASAAIACVVDYGPRASQWEAAAAAEWLTRLVDLMDAAESAQRQPSASPDGAEPPRRRLPTAAELVNEYVHLDDSPMSRKLLALLALGRRGSGTGSAYAMHALLQLALHLHTYLRARQRRASALAQTAGAATTAAAAVRDEDAAVLPLRPAGAASAPLWVELLQSIAADNRRLGRISAAFQRARTDTSGAALAVVVREAWSRATTAAEQIALQYAFAGAVFKALDVLLGDPPSGAQGGGEEAAAAAAAAAGTWVSPAVLCEAVAATVTVPTPSEVAALLGRRFHAALATHPGRDAGTTAFSLPSSPALLHGYQAAVQWACRVGARWLTGAYGACGGGVADANTCGEPIAPSPVRGRLPPVPHHSASFVEDTCAGALAVMTESTPGLSQRTRCLAASLVSAVMQVCPSELLPLLEARGAALFTASATLRRVAAVSGMQCRLLRRVRSAAECAARDTAGWVASHLAAMQRAVAYLKEHAQVPRSAADRSKESRHSPRPAPSPQLRDAGRAAREAQHFHVLVSLLTSLVACTGDTATAASGAKLLSPEQRQAVCAVLCDALRIEDLRGTVALATRAMADSAEGRCCLLTEIATAGDPLGRTLFGRLLALTLCMPTRWAGGVVLTEGATSRSCSPSSTPQDRHRRRTGSLSSPRLSPPATTTNVGSPLSLARTTPTRAEAAPSSSSWQAGDALCAIGCDVCARLCYAHTTGAAAAAAAAAADAEAAAATSSTAFLAAFMRHRGLDYLARVVVDCDRVQRRGGRGLAVPLHWLRLVAALSSHVSVAKALVHEADLFSVLLELAGTPMEAATPAGAATLALLALRNACFAEGLKAVLCQDARLLLTLKAACMGLTAVCQLIELPTARALASMPLPPPSTATTKRAGPVAGAVSVAAGPLSSGSASAARVDVRLREDVVDMANKAEVDWATQACVDARRSTAARSKGTAAPLAAAASAAPLAAPSTSNAAADPRRKTAGNSPPPRRILSDISNRRAASATTATTTGAALGDESLLDGGLSLDAEHTDMHAGQDSGRAVLERATDAEAPRRRYLAASALASLWFDNQRGRSAIAAVLATAPPLSMEEVQSLLSWSPA